MAIYQDKIKTQDTEVSFQTDHIVWLPKSTSIVTNRVGYYQSLPSNLKAGVKPVEKITIKVRTNSFITYDTDYTKDYVWLPSETELYGSRTYSYAAIEGTHYSTKYNSNSNRIKQKEGTNYYWWARSAFSSNAYVSCRVYLDGEADVGACGDINCGVAPAFCI